MNVITSQFGLCGIIRVRIGERQFGLSRIFLHIESAQQGNSRIANDIDGYNIYVGTDALPDLTQPPTLFSLTLPAYISVTPPGVGTRIFYVVVRKQNQFGIESQNSHYTTITIDSAGDLVLPPIPVPQSLGIIQQAGGVLQVMAAYPTVNTDIYPATVWKVWAGLVPPDPTIDTPAMVKAVSGKTLSTSFGLFSPDDLVYVVIGLYRQSDAALSPTLDGQITIVEAPSVPVPVLSGYQE